MKKYAKLRERESFTSKCLEVKHWPVKLSWLVAVARRAAKGQVASSTGFFGRDLIQQIWVLRDFLILQKNEGLVFFLLPEKW